MMTIAKYISLHLTNELSAFQVKDKSKKAYKDFKSKMNDSPGKVGEINLKIIQCMESNRTIVCVCVYNTLIVNQSTI